METLMKSLFGNLEGHKINNNISDNLMNYGITSVNSPFSLVSVFIPLMLGLSGTTLEETCNALGIKQNELPKLLGDFGNFYNSLVNSKNVKLSNVMLSNENVSIKSTYLQNISSTVSHESFGKDDIPFLVQKVNSLVEKNTNGMIKNLLDDNDIAEDVFFILLNTIYFMSNWDTKFEKRRTRNLPFYGISGERQEDLMKMSEESFKYFETSEYQVLRMPYENSSFSFCVVLPKNIDGKPLLMDSTDLINNVLSAKHETVNVTLPKFTQEQEIDMIPFLQSLGVNTLFTNRMEAKNMTDSTDPMYVSVIRQKAKIIVNEDGTEASASTAIICMMESCRLMSPPKNVYNFIANHPFTYYVIYEPLKLVLFSGTYE